MLIDMMTGRRITAVPYAEQYKRYMSALTPEEIAAIKAHLNGLIEGERIKTAGWMPGPDWTGSVFEPIYFKAAKRSYKGPLSALV